MLITEPDMFAEAIPYYVPDTPLYQMRRQRFGKVSDPRVAVRHDAASPGRLSRTRLCGLLDATTGRPVVIAIQHRLAHRPGASAGTKESELLVFLDDAGPGPAFPGRRPARSPTFRRVVSDETYEVYVLR